MLQMNAGSVSGGDLHVSVWDQPICYSPLPNRRFRFERRFFGFRAIKCGRDRIRSRTVFLADADLQMCFVAIDLPGLGQSKAAPAPAPVGQPAPGVFLRQVCEALQTGPVVIISPSLSGMYLLPFLFQHSEQVKAYIPVAPICTEKFTAEQYSSAQTPALIVYGDQDTQLGEVSLSNLKNLPNHKVVVMKGAGHPCYLDDPEIWHKAVLDFLQQL
ncbi:protein ABHD14B-like [Cyprinus carpio]|uniref:Protein ABHD14B-like n=1 Tax=Cyprinus carpio TaxID=7962 RepID=A0A9R0A0R6_CYPCA|nr:protein ABHD14B-like [Cyprinus carpio]